VTVLRKIHPTLAGKDGVHTIGITFNLKRKDSNSTWDDAYEEYDEPTTINAIKREIEKMGFDVILLEEDDNFLEKLLSHKPDFVFNIAEGRGNSRTRESYVPAILESMGIPYTGSDPLSLGITLDKLICNRLLKSEGVAVPVMYEIKNEDKLTFLKDMFQDGRRVIVKPRWEGSSKGIFLDSVVDNLEDLKSKVSFVLSKYKQPALVEEFLPGDEITVGVVGNTSPYVVGMMRISYKRKNKTDFLYSLETKRNWKRIVKHEGKESIPKIIQEKVEDYALRAFLLLGLRDFARIDFRLDVQACPKIIDVNPLAGLSPHYSDLPIAAQLNGLSYSELINLILSEAFRRYGFKSKR
jgi:D-alanine-D-alanine ligase